MDIMTSRKNRNMTQEDLAKKVGITRQMISAIENGARPSVEVAKQLGEILEFDWTKFYEENGDQIDVK